MRHFYRSPLIYEEEARARIAARKINKIGKGMDGCDIVGLCELWDDSMADIITEQVKQVYPHNCRPGRKSRIRYVIGPGLMLFSKHPIIDMDFVPFKTNGNIIEKSCLKGVLKAVVELDNNFPVTVLLSHFQAGQRSKERRVRLGQLSEIGAVLQDIKSGSYGNAPIVLMGDFNIIAEDRNGNPRPEYNAMTRILGLKDIYRTRFKSSILNPGYTSHGGENNLLHLFHRNTRTKKRIDYILSNNYRKMSIDDCQVDEFKTNNPIGNGTKKVKNPIQHLSDHYAVKARFLFEPDYAHGSGDPRLSDQRWLN
jgi:endonuclease/exonuclease/phosphatase family metal-dependent hydrolase